MNSRWSVAQNFQHIQVVISAINTLALSIKLEQAGISSNVEGVNAARTALEAFLEEMARVVHQLEGQSNQAVLGTEPYLRHLAESLIEVPAARYQDKAHTHPAELKASLEALDLGEGEQLVDDLLALRRILEEQIQDDTRPLGAF